MTQTLALLREKWGWAGALLSGGHGNTGRPRTRLGLCTPPWTPKLSHCTPGPQVLVPRQILPPEAKVKHKTLLIQKPERDRLQRSGTFIPQDG